MDFTLDFDRDLDDDLDVDVELDFDLDRVFLFLCFLAALGDLDRRRFFFLLVRSRGEGDLEFDLERRKPLFL